MSNLLPIHTSLHAGHNPSVQLERILAPKSVVFYVLNVLTLGLFSSAEAITKQHRIHYLDVQKEKLLQQVSELDQDWTVLDQDLKHVMEKLGKVHGPQADKKLEIETGVDDLQDKISALKGRKIAGTVASSLSFGEIVYDLIRFVGNLLANALTVGLYGVYQNYQLKNRIIILTSQNESIITSVEAINAKRCEDFSHLTDHLTAELKIRVLDEVSALNEAEEAKDKAAKLQQDLQKAQNEAAALRTAKVVDETRLNQEKLNLQAAATKKDQEMATLRNQLQSAMNKALKVQGLEAEIQRHKVAVEKLPEAHKPLAEIGAIPGRYQQKENDGLISGAFDGDHRLDADFAAEYVKRYGNKVSAAEIVASGLEYAFNTLTAQSGSGKKLQINKSPDTPYSPCMNSVFKYFVLDLLKGARLAKGPCTGPNFKVDINNKISMVSSKPHKVVRMMKDPDDPSGDGGVMKPRAWVEYQYRDDFTPTEMEMYKMGNRNYGLDAPSAKWVLEQLSQEEMDHLFNLLMSESIEDNNQDLINTRAFMQNIHNPRVELIQIGVDLISDLSSAIKEKFSIVYGPIFDKLADEDDLMPFVKEEDAHDPTKVPDTGMGQTKGDSYVEWTFDEDVLSDKRAVAAPPAYGYAGGYYGGYGTQPAVPVVKQQQPDFYELINLASAKYRHVFQNMKTLLKHPIKLGKEYHMLKWDDVNVQYHKCHEMIGADFEGEGGDRCLFSNLLAILLTDKADLTSENVSKLKKAMASYLDKPEAKKIFEDSIRETYKCTVAQYQMWLRGEPAKWDQKTFQYVHPAAVDLSSMTTLEISIAAWTLGVRIGVLPIATQAQAVVDKDGRIVPPSFYGPNTKEYFLMAWNKVGESFHGLFPKLNDDDGLTDYDEAVQEIEEYWKSIKPK